MVLTDAQWQLLHPLLDRCRPRHRTAKLDLRRTIEAIIWRHRNGAAWRAIPAELGPWWRAAQTFSRWGRLGVWERLLEAAQGGGAGIARVPGCEQEAASRRKPGLFAWQEARGVPILSGPGSQTPR